jgi:ABC-type nitrate/sulfonate/bicarbonate transport system permease component
MDASTSAQLDSPSAVDSGSLTPDSLDLPLERRGWRDYLLSEPALGLGSAAVLLAIWEWASRSGLANPMFVGSPSQIAQSFWKLFFVTGDIWPHLIASAQIGFLGMLGAIVIGIPVGCAIGRYHIARGLLEPYVVAMYSTPRIAFLPLIILVLGIGIFPKAVLVFLGAVFPILVNAQVGVEQADRGLIEMGRSCRASERQIFTKIILPGALPFIVAGFRLALGRALITIVVAELFASNVGVGYFISRMSAQFRAPDMFVGILSLTFAGVTLSMLVRILEQRMAPWLVRE